MSKQILHNVKSLEENGGSSIVKIKSDLSSSLPRKYKLLLVFVGALAAVTVCAAVTAVAVAIQTSEMFPSTQQKLGETELQDDPLIDVAKREELLKQVAVFEGAKGDARAAGRSNQTKTNCYSRKLNGTHPAAHISGEGFRWTPVEPGTIDPFSTAFGYGASWVCANDSGSFVDGGMYFKHREQKLYVPDCGYYYISSHVFFQSDSSSTASTNSNYVRHEINIERNCTSYTDNRLKLRSYSSLAVNSENFGRTNTHIGDVVKMCEGGSIFVSIPSNQPCCPIGIHPSTYFSAFMVAKTTCEPPMIDDHPPSIQSDDS